MFKFRKSVLVNFFDLEKMDKFYTLLSLPIWSIICLFTILFNDLKAIDKIQDFFLYIMISCPTILFKD